MDNFGTVTFASGQTTAQITFVYIGNPFNPAPPYEGPRTIQVTIGNPTGGATLGADTTSVLTIDDPEDQEGEFGISTFGSDSTVPENAGTAQIEVVRVGNLTTDVGVAYTTVDGTAKAGTNYVATSGFVEFQPGQTEAFIYVPILDDHLNDNPGTFQFVLSGGIGIGTGVTVPIGLGQNQWSVTILDSDTPPPPPPQLRGRGEPVL